MTKIEEKVVQMMIDYSDEIWMDEATALAKQIHALYMESLPERKSGAGSLDAWYETSEGVNIQDGYNQCLAEIKERWGE